MKALWALKDILYSTWAKTRQSGISGRIRAPLERLPSRINKYLPPPLSALYTVASCFFDKFLSSKWPVSLTIPSLTLYSYGQPLPLLAG